MCSQCQPEASLRSASVAAASLGCRPSEPAGDSQKFLSVSLKVDELNIHEHYRPLVYSWRRRCSMIRIFAMLRDHDFVFISLLPLVSDESLHQGQPLSNNYQSIALAVDK